MRKNSLILLVGFILILSVVFFFFFNQKKTQVPVIKKDNKSVQVQSRSAPGSCKILPEEYCGGGKVIQKEINGQLFKIVGFKLPEGTPLYSHKDGRFNKGVTPGELFVGSFGAIMGKPGEGGFSVYGDIKFSNNSGDIKRGDIIGTIQNTGVTNFGEYNLIIMATRANAEGTRPETDTETLTRLFPGFSEMEPVKRIDKGNAPLKPSIGSPIYSDTPLSDKDK